MLCLVGHSYYKDHSKYQEGGRYDKNNMLNIKLEYSYNGKLKLTEENYYASCCQCS